jgi:UDP-2,3-diacylglucosamine pyrophosphatase LpxH
MADQRISIAGECAPQFDELYVISDLHLGGTGGFQIFCAGDELSRLITHLSGRVPNKNVALVINGDFIDFLAEPQAKYLDPENAIAKLNRIMADAAFRPVWEALRAFTRVDNRHLIINLGNHDVELALPWVKAHLLACLAPDAAARQRILFISDGSGFLCRVGPARVLCVHGNEVDTWNLVDYEALRRLGRDLTQGRPAKDWVANAGTRLVIDVMNDIKERYPFVDLLKPEIEAVLPTVLALEPESVRKIDAVLGVGLRLGVDRLRQAAGFLSSQGEEGSVVPLSPVPVRRRAEPGGAAHTQALLDQMEERMATGVDPLTLVDDDQQGKYLGWASAAFKGIRGETTSEVLREALQGLRNDRSFKLNDKDDTYKGLDEWIGSGAEFIVAGHSHLERSLPRSKQRGWYFNSGTWARLIELEEGVLTEADRFAAVFTAIKTGTMQALEDTPGLVLRRYTVVAIVAGDGGVVGELRHVRAASHDLWETVPDSRSHVL